jgi:undecaprenyl pyrophosphate phosphatase UppP
MMILTDDRDQKTGHPTLIVASIPTMLARCLAGWMDRAWLRDVKLSPTAFATLVLAFYLLLVGGCSFWRRANGQHESEVGFMMIGLAQMLARFRAFPF